MDARTLKALRDSIAAWEEKREFAAQGYFRGIEMGSGACPLCHLFISYGCKGCPVQMETGEKNCEGSPFDEASHSRGIVVNKELNGLNTTEAQSKLLGAIDDEIAFLKGLLPQSDD